MTRLFLRAKSRARSARILASSRWSRASSLSNATWQNQPTVVSMTSAKEVIPIAWNRSRTLSVTISRRWSSSCWQSQQTLGRSDIWDYKYPNRSNSPSSILERDWISLTGLSQKQEKSIFPPPPKIMERIHIILWP